MTGLQRGDVRRECSRLLLVHVDEGADQFVRETRSIQAKVRWEVPLQPILKRSLRAATLEQSRGQPFGLSPDILGDRLQAISRMLPREHSSGDYIFGNFSRV